MQYIDTWLATENARAEALERGAHGRKMASIAESLTLARWARQGGSKTFARMLINSATATRNS